MNRWFFRIFGINIFKVTASLRFLSLTARGYVQPLTTEHCGSVHYITIGDSRLLTAAGLTRSPLYLIGDAASRCGLSRVGYFIPLNGRRPLNRHPPSILYSDLMSVYLMSHELKTAAVVLRNVVKPQGKQQQTKKQGTLIVFENEKFNKK